MASESLGLQPPEEEPEIEVRLFEVPLAVQLRGLRSGDFSIGFAYTGDVGNGALAEPIWQDPLMLALSIRHPLLVHKEIPFRELARHQLLLCDPQLCDGLSRELARLLQLLDSEPNVAERVTSHDMMLTLAGAGYGVGFTTATWISTCRRTDVVFRPLAMEPATITTYLLRPDNDSLSGPLERFVARLRTHAGR